jgi:predicted secreted protein
MKKSCIFAALVLVAAFIPVYAGDVATFVNLGFSPDSAYFMFGQYGVQQSTLAPYAETYLVDNARNEFVPRGVARKVYSRARIEAGQDASGAFYTLFSDEVSLARRYHIDHLLPGSLLYVLLDGQEPPATLNFRDFKTGASYDVALNQQLLETKESVSSSFGIAVTVTAKDGTVRRVTCGSPDIRRLGVKAYAIRRIVQAPDGKTLVFIVEKRLVASDDGGIRYMVETVKLP